jgi:NTE family protein
VPDALREVQEGDAALLGWLEECEARASFLVFVPDTKLTSWTRACVAQSDEVLLFAESDEPAPLGETERYACAAVPAKRRRLVRIHRQRRATVTGTRAWLQGREVFMTHHVACEEEEDWASLRRFLTGRAIGFVAGGGGAFGPAHIGIYYALRERGIVFDIFGGASVGSAMAAAFALKMEPPTIIEGIRDIFVANRAFRRMTIPRYALLDHRALDAGLQRHYGAVAIEDMWNPYFALAADLSASEPCVIRTGPLWQAIRASSAIPGVLPPFFTEDGHMLVDGGIVDNVPLQPMSQIKAGPNVAIILDPPRKRVYDVAYDRLPGPMMLALRLALPRLRRQLPACPSPVDVIMQSLFAQPWLDAPPSGPEDLILKAPRFPGSSFLDWSAHAEIVEESYRWARTTLRDLAESGDPALAALEGAVRS